MDTFELIGWTVMCMAITACVPGSGIYAAPVATAPTEQDSAPDPRTPARLAPPGQRVRSPAFDQAQAARSSAALIMFLIHHRDDPALSAVRDVLAHRSLPDSPAALAAAAGPEAGVVAAFDAARLTGTAAAWQAFLARYPDHILASEAGYFSPR